MSKNDDNLIYSAASPEKVAADLQPLINFQDDGISLGELSELIEKCLIPYFVRYNRPEFHSLYNFYPEEGAELGARIALKYNQGVTNWQVSPGAVMLEELCGRVLCKLFGLSENSDATFMYCGTYANQQGLYMALHRRAEQEGFNLAEKGLKGFKDPNRLMVVTSEESHFSLLHALRIMGLGDQSLVTIPVDNNFRMDVARLKETVGKYKKEKDIFCIVSTAGTTSTGSIDPILPLAELCEEIGTWFHVDGAFGLAFYLIPEYKHFFSGVEQADSVCWDPHKQFGVPIPNSVLFVRRKEDFNRMAIYGDYFNREGDTEPNPGLKSPPTTRPLSSLPLVTTIRYQGMRKLVQRLRIPLMAIKSFAENLKNESDFELCHRPETALLCVRIIPKGFPAKRLNQLQQYVYEKIKVEGKRSISMTKLGDKTVLRFVALSPSVTVEALIETAKTIRHIAGNYLK